MCACVITFHIVKKKKKNVLVLQTVFVFQVNLSRSTDIWCYVSLNVFDSRVEAQ